MTSESVSLRRLVLDLFEHIDLLPMLARQHFRGQFRAASLGLAWSVFQPIVQGLVLTIIFTRVVPIDAGVPYAAFAFTGTATWAFISTSIVGGVSSIIDTSSLATKVYFPRLLLPATPASSAVPTYTISLLLAALLSVGFGIRPAWTWLALPLVMFGTWLLVVSLSFVTALMNVYFRDVKHIVSSATLVLFYITPVIYPVRIAPRSVRLVLELNPFTGVLQATRWAIFGSEVDVALARPLLVSGLWTAVFAVTGLLAYRRFDRVAVDRL